MEVEEKHSFESIPPSKATEHGVDSRRLIFLQSKKDLHCHSDSWRIFSKLKVIFDCISMTSSISRTIYEYNSNLGQFQQATYSSKDIIISVKKMAKVLLVYPRYISECPSILHYAKCDDSRSHRRTRFQDVISIDHINIWSLVNHMGNDCTQVHSQEPALC